MRPFLKKLEKKERKEGQKGRKKKTGKEKRRKNGGSEEGSKTRIQKDTENKTGNVGQLVLVSACLICTRHWDPSPTLLNK